MYLQNFGKGNREIISCSNFQRTDYISFSTCWCSLIFTLICNFASHNRKVSRQVYLQKRRDQKLVELKYAREDSSYLPLSFLNFIFSAVWPLVHFAYLCLYGIWCNKRFLNLFDLIAILGMKLLIMNIYLRVLSWLKQKKDNSGNYDYLFLFFQG